MRVRALAVCLALVVPFIAACDSEDTARREISVLRVGVLPDQEPQALQQRYTPLFEHLASELDIPYEFVASESYEELVEQFAAGRMDLAYFGGLTFLQASAAGRAEPLVMRDVDSKFVSCFLVRTDSPATGAHDKTAYDVRGGRADLGAANCRVVKSMFADGRLRRHEVRVLWETPPYPDYVGAVRPDIDSVGKRRIRDAFLMLSPAGDDHRPILRRLNAGAFLPAGIDDFTALREIAGQVPLLAKNR